MPAPQQGERPVVATDTTTGAPVQIGDSGNQAARVNVVSNDTLDGVQAAYDANGNLIYFGRAVPGTLTSAASWQIRKLAYDANGNMLSITWAGGARTFVNVWDNHAALSYS